MSKKVKVLIAVMLAILLMAVGSAVVMAQEEPEPTPEAGAKGLLARVADILDIPQEDLIDAFGQARQEMRQEACIRFLDRAVEGGRITQGEADQIIEWRGQRPEVLGSDMCPHTFGFPAFSGRHMWGGHGGWYWTR